MLLHVTSLWIGQSNSTVIPMVTAYYLFTVIKESFWDRLKWGVKELLLQTRNAGSGSIGIHQVQVYMDTEALQSKEKAKEKS